MKNSKLYNQIKEEVDEISFRASEIAFNLGILVLFPATCFYFYDSIATDWV